MRKWTALASVGLGGGRAERNDLRSLVAREETLQENVTREQVADFALEDEEREARVRIAHVHLLRGALCAVRQQAADHRNDCGELLQRLDLQVRTRLAADARHVLADQVARCPANTVHVLVKCTVRVHYSTLFDRQKLRAEALM